MKRVFGKLSRGSILAYTLILLGIVLTASMGMFMSSMRDLRSVGTQERSMQAFQIANSGSEMAISAIKENPDDLDGLATEMGGATCNAGEITKGTASSPYLGGETRLSFFDDAGTKIISCSEDVYKIASVKSVGTFKETARAVEVAVAAGNQIVTILNVRERSGGYGNSITNNIYSLETGFDPNEIAETIDSKTINQIGLNPSGVLPVLANFVDASDGFDGVGCKAPWRAVSCMEFSTSFCDGDVCPDGGDYLPYHVGDIDGCVSNDWDELSGLTGGFAGSNGISMTFTIKCMK